MDEEYDWGFSGNTYEGPVFDPPPLTKYEKSQKTKPVKTEIKQMAEKTLYEINEGDGIARYGHKLAVNSQGKWVMELKGSGDVLTYDKSMIQEVMPYTVSIVWCESGKEYAYLDTARVASKGDFFVFDSGFHGTNGNYQIVKVVGVDTKSKVATKEFIPLKKL